MVHMCCISVLLFDSFLIIVCAYDADDAWGQLRCARFSKHVSGRAFQGCMKQSFVASPLRVFVSCMIVQNGVAFRDQHQSEGVLCMASHFMNLILDLISYYTCFRIINNQCVVHMLLLFVLIFINALQLSAVVPS